MLRVYQPYKTFLFLNTANRKEASEGCLRYEGNRESFVLEIQLFFIFEIVFITVYE